MIKPVSATVFILVGILCIFQESVSVPQTGIPVGAQFGEINNNGSDGGTKPYGELSNQTSSVPGSGYPGQYYSNHSNETAPTSPTVSGDSVDIQNAGLPTSTCDGGQSGSNGQAAAGEPDASPAGSGGSDTSRK